MSRHRQTLFEQIRPDAESQRDRYRVPEWAQPGQQVDRADTTDQPWAAVSGIRYWMGTLVGLRLRRGSVVVILLVMVGLLALSFYLGSEYSRGAAMDELAVRSPVHDIRDGPINEALLAPRGPTGSGPDGSLSPSGAVSDARGSRQPGLNYFRLMLVPDDYRTDAERAQAFLVSHGIDSQLISVKNGRFWKLVVLHGFSSPRTDPAAQALNDQLRRLGRLWKSEHKGATDWADLYPEKYLGD